MIMAAADVHADDAGTCPVFQIQGMTCFNALDDDDNDSSDNRAATSAFGVVSSPRAVLIVDIA